MKKNLKGFTLMELITVMAILVILMAAIMNMFKPIRETYVDATLYETQRTSQNGVVQYITESVRYSTDLGMYTKDKVSNVSGAVDKFIVAYLKANGVNDTDAADTSKYTTTRDELKKNAEVIIIDNISNYTYNNGTYHGRILRRKIDGNAITNDAEDPTKKDKCRLALGAAYYGESDYTISFKVKQDSTNGNKGDASEGIKVTVASGAKHGLRDIGNRDGFVAQDKLDETKAAYDTTIIKTSGLVMCKNQCAPINGLFDTTNFTATSSTGTGTKVYIVYINDKVDVVP